MDQSITSIKPEDLAKIQAELKAEAESQPDNPLDKALQTATELRENLKAINGKEYLQIIEAGLLIRKQMELMAFVCAAAKEMDPDGFGRIHKQLGAINGHIGARILAHACSAAHMEKLDGKQLTEWIDRIAEAEHDGVAGLIDELKKED